MATKKNVGSSKVVRAPAKKAVTPRAKPGLARPRPYPFPRPVDSKIPSILGVNPMFERFGRLRDPQRMKLLLGALQGLVASGLSDAELGEQLVVLGQKYGYVKNDVEAEHLRKDWFSGWFPQSPVATVFVQTLIVGLERMLDREGDPLPMAAYWSAGPDEVVRGAVAESAHQVTVMFSTPLPAARRKRAVLELPKRDPVWILSPDKKGQVAAIQHKMTRLKV